MKTTEKKIYVSEMEFTEYTFLLGLLIKLSENNTVSIKSNEDEAMVKQLIDGMRIK